MRCFFNSVTEPGFNLAAEEYLLTRSHEDCFMLWRNRRAIIVGRNQNTQAQINPEYVAARKIPVVRRLSGGGAVYHDLGNVNFTLIKTAGTSRDLKLAAFTRPVLNFLHRLGVPARFDGRNDLAVGGRKISGNAQHIHNGRVLHHGTLLFDVDLDALATALLVDPVKYRDKAVKSIRKRVTNICRHLEPPVSVGQFMERLLSHIETANNGYRDVFSPADTAAIQKLAREKYDRWEWNYGRSPTYNFRKSARTPGGTLDVYMDVQKGVIRSVRLYGDYFGAGDVRDVETALEGCPHTRPTVAAVIGGLPVETYLKGFSREALVAALF